MSSIRQDVFTASQIAHALHRSKRSVCDSLTGSRPTGTKIVSGNVARAWSSSDVPPDVARALQDAASRRQISVDALLASPSPLWRPRLPLSDLREDAIERASLLRRALAPAFARLNDVGLSSAQFEQIGVEDYRRTFGHSISTRHWRRLFQRTVDRDGGARHWTRLEIYLDESPVRRVKTLVSFAPAALRPLQDLIASFQNPIAPTNLEEDCLWIYTFEHCERETARLENQKRSNAPPSNSSTTTPLSSVDRLEESKCSSI